MIVLAPMAGICDSSFLLKFVPYGFDVLSLGGYNCDEETVNAGKEIIKRGRKEFDIDPEKLIDTISQEVKTLKNEYNGLISANLRAISPDSIIEISKIKDLDIIEINAHCRQKEILDLNCGQAMLKDLEFFEDYISEVKNKSDKKVSVKIRANVVDTLEVAKIVEDSKIDYLHIDAMKPGYAHADLDLMKNIAENTKIHIIGNNSIVDLKSAIAMQKTGVESISIARATLNGKIDFDLNQLK